MRWQDDVARFARKQIDVDHLRQLVSVNPDTGLIMWRERPVALFSSERAAAAWNARFSGAPAFAHLSKNGYLTGLLYRRPYMAHRIVFAFCIGRWPVKELDHINHDKTDNRLNNLREVSRRENLMNKPMMAHNTSGVTGVTRAASSRKWRAVIKVNGETIHLGTFENLRDAVAARSAAERLYGFHPNHGKRHVI